MYQPTMPPSITNAMHKEDLRAACLQARFHNVQGQSNEKLIVACSTQDLGAQNSGENLEEKVLGYMIVRRPKRAGDDPAYSESRVAPPQLADYFARLETERKKYVTEDTWGKSAMPFYVHNYMPATVRRFLY